MQRMDQLTILKIGGSVITDKARECTPDISAIQRIADQLSDYDLPLILIHGGGFFGHPFVPRTGINRGVPDPSPLHPILETGFYLSQATRVILSTLPVSEKLPVSFYSDRFV